MPTSTFPGVTVETATNGALSGDGSSGNKLAVAVDTSTITVNGSNQLHVVSPATSAPAAWSSLTTYATGNVVTDRDGIWRATGASSNSQPVVGNTNWTLLSGTPYVDTTLTASEIAALNSARQQLLPAAAGEDFLHPTLAAFEFYPDENVGGPSFSGSARTWNFKLGTAITVALWYANSAGVTTLTAGMMLESTEQYGATPFGGQSSNGAIWWSESSDFQNVPFTIGASAAFTILSGEPIATSLSSAGSGYYAGQLVKDDTSGTFTATVNTVDAVGAILTYTVTSTGTTTYAVNDNISLTSVTTIPVTAVNQGAKTFTVAGNQASKFSATGFMTVAGSTGNDGLYTVVSAVFGVATVITVVEAIPSAVADGAINPGGDSAQLVVDEIHNASLLKIRTYYTIVPELP